jgi:stalled ribosome rescue protein Dom34
VEFRERAWNIFQPQYQARLAALADEFALAKSKGLGQEDLKQVAAAATAGRIATLLIEADRQISGRIDGATGEVEFKDLSHPESDDLLDDLGELVLKTGGHVVVVPADRMPTMTGAAAICRF